MRGRRWYGLRFYVVEPIGIIHKGGLCNYIKLEGRLV